MRRFRLAGLVCAGALMASFDTYGQTVAPADLVILGAHVYTVDAARPEAEQGSAHGYVVLDAADGTERFRLLYTDCQATSNGLVVSPMDTYLGGSDVPRGITCRDALTGAERWFVREQVNGCPIVTQDAVFLDPDPEVRRTAIGAATYPAWRDFEPRLEVMAEHDNDADVRALAQRALDSFRRHEWV